MTRRLIAGAALGLGLLAAVACSGDSAGPTEAPALPTSTAPAARATQPAIAPDLKNASEGVGSASEGASGPKQGGIFNTLWSDPPTLDPHLVTDGTSYGIVIEIFSGLVRLGPNTLNPFEPDGGRVFLYVLAAIAACPEDVDTQVVGVYRYLFGLVGLGQDLDECKTGVPAVIGVEGR